MRTSTSSIPFPYTTLFRSIASVERLLSDPPGLVPAEWTSIASPARCRSSAAAIWDLPPFLTQTKRALGLGAGAVVMVGLPEFCGRGRWGRSGRAAGQIGRAHV